MQQGVPVAHSFEETQLVNRSILVVFLPEEEPAAAWAVGSLLPQIEDGDTLLLLHNGAKDRSFAEKYARLPGVRFFEQCDNLGVAGGRNFLLRQPECRESDLVFLVDSDAIVPCDYLRKMTEFIDATPDAGVVGPVALSFPYLRQKLRGAGFFPGGTGGPVSLFGDEFDTAAIRSLIAGNLYEDAVDHIGTAPEWRRAYLSQELFLETVETMCHAPAVEGFHGSLKNDAQSLARLSDGAGHLEVGNVAGCCQVFRRSLIDEIGYLCDLYNPYGFEDVDFSIRAITHGKRNYTTNATYLLHRTDLRHATRTLPQQRFRNRCNDSRVRTIFEFRWARTDFPAVTVRRLIGRYLVESGKSNDARENILAALFGVRRALLQIAAYEGPGLSAAIRQGGDPFAAFERLLEEPSAKVAEPSTRVAA